MFMLLSYFQQLPPTFNISVRFFMSCFHGITQYFGIIGYLGVNTGRWAWTNLVKIKQYYTDIQGFQFPCIMLLQHKKWTGQHLQYAVHVFVNEWAIPPMTDHFCYSCDRHIHCLHLATQVSHFGQDLPHSSQSLSRQELSHLRLPDS